MEKSQNVTVVGTVNLTGILNQDGNVYFGIFYISADMLKFLGLSIEPSGDINDCHCGCVALESD